MDEGITWHGTADIHGNGLTGHKGPHNTAQHGTTHNTNTRTQMLTHTHTYTDMDTHQSVVSGSGQQVRPSFDLFV